MHKLLWVVNVMLAAALSFWILVGTGNDNDDKAQPEPSTTTTTAPEVPAEEFVADGPNAERLKAAVSDLDLSAFMHDEDYEGWEIGRISEVKGPVNIMLMMTGKQTDVFYGVDDEDCIPEDYFATLLDPGDIVLWSTEGDDARLCAEEILVVKEAK